MRLTLTPNVFIGTAFLLLSCVCMRVYRYETQRQRLLHNCVSRYFITFIFLSVNQRSAHMEFTIQWLIMTIFSNCFLLLINPGNMITICKNILKAT